MNVNPSPISPGLPDGSSPSLNQSTIQTQGIAMTVVESWNDWEAVAPKNPLSIIANARFASTPGRFIYSNTYTPNSPPDPTTVVLSGEPECVALESNNLQKVADANQWNFQHLSSNSNPNLAIPLRKVIFLRGGTSWEMIIPLDLGGTYTNIQLSFRDNAGTLGYFTGTVPVIEFAGTFSGQQTLKVTLHQIGRAVMGLRFMDSGGDWNMYESEWIIVP